MLYEVVPAHGPWVRHRYASQTYAYARHMAERVYDGTGPVLIEHTWWPMSLFPLERRLPEWEGGEFCAVTVKGEVVAYIVESP